MGSDAEKKSEPSLAYLALMVPHVIVGCTNFVLEKYMIPLIHYGKERTE